MKADQPIIQLGESIDARETPSCLLEIPSDEPVVIRLTAVHDPTKDAVLEFETPILVSKIILQAQAVRG